jgi:hypothetical protein
MRRQGAVGRASIRREFELARVHSRLAPGKVRLIIATPPPEPRAEWAVWYYPGFEITGESGPLLRGNQREAANSAGQLGLHRLVVRTDLDLPRRTAVAVLAGLIRHELEHAIQWEAEGWPLFELDLLTDQLIDAKAGPAPRDAPLYRRKPREEDANAAAADFLRYQHPECLDNIAGDDRFAELVRSNHGPPDPGSLLVRTVCFQFLYWDLTRHLEFEDEVSGWAELLDQTIEGAGGIWRALEDALPEHLRAA